MLTERLTYKWTGIHDQPIRCSSLMLANEKYLKAVTTTFAGAEILLAVSGVPLNSTDGEVQTPVDQSATGDQMELKVETEIQGDDITAGED
jgi:hypothetical protein